MSELRRRVPTQVLRGVDAVTLEILIGDLVEKPLGQVAPANIADLWALVENPDAPVNIRRRMANWHQRMSVEIADIPNIDILATAEEWKAVEAPRVPETLRQIWRDELEKPKRGAREKQAIADLVAAWDETAPESFVIAAPRPATKAAPRQSAAEPRAAAPRIQKIPAAAPTEAAPRARSAGVASTPRPKPEEDPARNQWVREVAFNRLAHAPEQGLMEEVLVVGIKHRARDHFPNLQKGDILAVLREMMRLGQVRTSAGRWMIQVR
jgi:hypothetical protein